jgi:hypothetical protein
MIPLQTASPLAPLSSRSRRPSITSTTKVTVVAVVPIRVKSFSTVTPSANMSIVRVQLEVMPHCVSIRRRWTLQ